MRRWCAPLLGIGIFAIFATGLNGCIVVPNEDYVAGSDETRGDDGGESGDDAMSGGMSDLPPRGLACGENDTVTDPECPPACDWCDGDTCVIRCGGKQVCEKRDLDCPPGHPCRVECDGEQSCKDVKVRCPESHDCYVGCQGSQTCEKLDVECSTGTCELGCGIGNETCKGAKLECGSNTSKLTCISHEPSASVMPPSDQDCACELGAACAPGGGGGDGGDDDDDD